MTSEPLTGDVVPVEPPRPADSAVMPLVDHLSELRRRLVIAALAIAAGSVLGFFLSDVAIQVLEAPLPPGIHLIVTDIGDAFGIKLKLAIVIGIIVAMPILLWQFWRFVAPGLTAGERRVVLPWIPATLLFFAVGVGVAYLILPYAAGFLLGFTTNVFTPLLSASSYFGFVSLLFLAFGIMMEFPVVLIGLSRVGVVTSAGLRARRRWVILGSYIFAAAVTPGVDLVSPTVLWIVLMILYQLSIVVIARSGR